MRKIYLLDGTTDGFFTAVFDAYKEEKAYLTKQKNVQVGLFDECISVNADEEKAGRVQKKLRSISSQGYNEVLQILRTNLEDGAQIAFQYLKLLVAYGGAARSRLTEPTVRRALELCGQVWTEVHRLKGFLRFQETATGLLYAHCKPDNDVVELLMPHFIARLHGIPFVIHDVARSIAGLYDGSAWTVAAVGEAEIALSEKEISFSSLWKNYYRTVAIPSRKNVRQQKNYMPTRYWSTLVEDPREE
ncbi:MAG: TIGR03915 family putative DNA repair protein [Clostridia bacterium]|nr:TIGR03915 family putative DNA repair protein [Clostridia bacterium]